MSDLFRVDGLWARPAEVSGTAAGDSADHLLCGLDLTVGHGEIHVVLGPNGSGTSTLGSCLLGSPGCEITDGTITFLGDDVTDWPPDERAKAGMFLAFQHPQVFPGVSVVQLLRQALSARTGIDLTVRDLHISATEWTKRLGMDASLVDRPLDESLSDGERARHEIVQMAILEPALAVLDETDRGLDVDTASVVARGVREMRADRPSMGVVLITSHQRLLDEIEPDHVHVLVDGRIVATGGTELAAQFELHGDDAFRVPA